MSVMESNKQRVISSRKRVLLHSWECIEKIRRVAEIISLPAMFPWVVTKGLRKPYVNVAGSSVGLVPGLASNGLRFMAFGMTRYLFAYLTAFTMTALCLSPWTIASPIAAVVKIALDIIYDSQDAEGSNFNDIVVYRYRDAVSKGESFFHYYVPMLRLFSCQLQDAVSKEAVGAYGYSTHKMEQIIQEIEDITKSCEVKKTLTNSTLDLIRLEEHGRQWVDDFVKQCTKPVIVIASDAAKQIDQGLSNPFGEAAKYDSDVCYLAVSYKRFNGGFKTVLSEADRQEIAEEAVRFANGIGAEAVALWVDFNAKCESSDAVARRVAPFLACPIVRAYVRPEDGDDMWLGCEQILSAAHGGFTRDSNTESDHVVRVVTAPRHEEVLALFVDVWRCGAAESLQAATSAEKEALFKFLRSQNLANECMACFWRNARASIPHEHLPSTGNGFGIGMAHLAALTKDVSETRIGKKYLEAKSQGGNDGNAIGWNMRRALDNRERSAEETEAGLFDARVYVGGRGKVCWLVANIGKSRVVKRIEVENGRTRLRGQVRRVDMERWPDGTSSEISFAEITGCIPDKVKRVGDIRWT